MTVQTSTNVASFNGDGANKVFPIGYKFNSAADLVVTLIDDEAKTTQILTLNSDFTVTGAGDEEGGVVTLVVAPTAVQRLKVTRVVDILQLTDLRNQGKFYAEIHEDVFDLLIMIDQQQQTEIDDANAKSDEAVATANEANAKSDQAVAKADQNLVNMQAQYDAFEQGAALYVIGDYAAGLVISAYNQIFRKDGEFYRAAASLDLPYTLTGNWATESVNFVSVGDAVLRQELAATDGAKEIGYKPDATSAVPDTVLGSLARTISVFDFMSDELRADALLDVPTLDHTAAVQAFFNALSVRSYPSAELSGNLRITSKVTLSASKTLTVRVNAKLIAAFAAEDEVFQLLDSPFTHFVGRLQVVCGGGAVYAERTNGFGVRINNSYRCRLDELHVQYAKYDGVHIVNGSDAGDGNSNLWSIGKLKVESCGSGKAGTTSGIRMPLASVSSTGSANSFAQRAVLGVTTLPTGIRADDLVKVGSSLHAITAVDYTANTVTVFPWLEAGSSATATGDVDFYLGAALYTRGGDSSEGVVEQFDAMNCGVAYGALSLYPALIGSAVVQACAVGVRIGRAPSGAASGGCIPKLYTELNDFDVVQCTSYSALGFVIESASTVQLSKCFSLSPRGSTGTPLAQYAALRGVRLTISEAILQPRPVLFVNARTIALDPKPGMMESIRTNTATITLTRNDDSERLLNASDTALLVAGSGAQNAPTGTITFAPPSGCTINGGAVDATQKFSGFSGPVMFYIRKEAANFVVQRCDLEATLSASVVYDWPSLATGAQASTTVSVPGAAVGDLAQASMSVTLNGCHLWAEVTATDVATVYLRNETGGGVDLASATVKVRVRKA
jgi:hypothetical protein